MSYRLTGPLSLSLFSSYYYYYYHTVYMFYQLVGIGEGKKGEKMNIVYTERAKKKVEEERGENASSSGWR